MMNNLCVWTLLAIEFEPMVQLTIENEPSVQSLFDLGGNLVMWSFLLTVVLFLMPVIFIIAIIWLIVHAKNKRARLQAEIYGKALEKGQEVPANFFTSVTPKSKQLNTGITLIASGIGISLFFLLIYGMREDDSSNGALKGTALGVIPFFIGIGYLLIYFIGKKQEQKDDAK